MIAGPVAVEVQRAGDVLLVPRMDLHTGYHGAMLEQPPPGIRLHPGDPCHRFVFQGEVGSPFELPHLGEFVECERRGAVVHSARWPVLGASGWVADTDDLLYAAVCGRTAMNESFRMGLASRVDTGLMRAVRMRVENMLSAYRHPSCAAVLLRGQPATSLATARQWFDHLGLTSLGEEYLGKVIAVRPARRSADRERVFRKWSTPGPLRVVFCGRDFDTKNGLLALQAMARVRARVPAVEFTYIGPIPEAVRRNQAGLMAGVVHVPALPHEQSLAVLADAHVLFHPSKFESVGLVLLEAAASCVAVVAARGGGMDYADDLFSTGGALLVDRDRTTAVEEGEAFTDLVMKVAQDRNLARGMAMRNYDQVAIGDYSINRQNMALAAAYGRAADSRAVPLSLEALPHAAGRAAMSSSAREIKRMEVEFRLRHGVSQLRFDL